MTEIQRVEWLAWRVFYKRLEAGVMSAGEIDEVVRIVKDWGEALAVLRVGHPLPPNTLDEVIERVTVEAKRVGIGIA